MTWSLPYKCLTCGNKMDVWPRVACADVFCSVCGIKDFSRVVWAGPGAEPGLKAEKKREVTFGPVLGHIANQSTKEQTCKP